MTAVRVGDGNVRALPVVDVPSPPPPGARVGVAPVGTCGTDLHLSGPGAPLDVTVTLGHEVAGVTEAGTAQRHTSRHRAARTVRHLRPVPQRRAQPVARQLGGGLRCRSRRRHGRRDRGPRSRRRVPGSERLASDTGHDSRSASLSAIASDTRPRFDHLRASIAAPLCAVGRLSAAARVAWRSAISRPTSATTIPAAASTT